MSQFVTYLRLMRPANIVTAWADILAGFGIVILPVLYVDASQAAYFINLLIILILTTTGLYGAGVVFNDVCDAELDKRERPERPIPRNIISRFQATVFAFLLMLAAIVLAFTVSLISGLIAIAIALLSITYDAYMKHYLWLGPINMGLCRSANLLLGLSISESGIVNHYFLAILPLVYIMGVTLASKGEVHGNNKSILVLAAILYFITVLLAGIFLVTNGLYIYSALIFLSLFSYLIFGSLIKAIKINTPNLIKKAVKTSIIGLIILDAAIAAGYAGWWYGLIMIVALFPLSLFLAKKFSVT